MKFFGKPQKFSAWVLALVLALAFSASQALAVPVIDGDGSDADWASATVQLDPANDVLPSPTASGFDVVEARVLVDATNNDMYFRFKTLGVPGDADGDGNPNVSTTPNIYDEFGLGGNEVFQISLDCDSNGVADYLIMIMDNTPFIIDVRIPDAWVLIDPNTATWAMGDGSDDAHKVVEIKVSAYEVCPTFVAAGGFSFGVQALSGTADDLAPEDLVPDAGFLLVEPIPPQLVSSIDLQKTIAPDPAYIGEKVKVTLVVTNDGETTLCNVTVTDVLPGCLRLYKERLDDDDMDHDGTPDYLDDDADGDGHDDAYDGDRDEDGIHDEYEMDDDHDGTSDKYEYNAGCVSAPQTLNFNLDCLNPGESKTVDFDAMVTCGDAQALNNTATVQGTPAVGDPVSDQASAVVAIFVPAPGVEIDKIKIAGPDTVQVSAPTPTTFTLLITVTNTGNTVLNDVQVRDQVPAKLTGLNYVPSQGLVSTEASEGREKCNLGADNIRWHVGSLAVGASATLQFDEKTLPNPVCSSQYMPTAASSDFRLNKGAVVKARDAISDARVHAGPSLPVIISAVGSDSGRCVTNGRDDDKKKIKYLRSDKR